ncbi:MAG: helix-turn-helix domain-containing protein [Firmicutes bacterium]|nr:helix-turn-helix domain-containing protein [Bacillota bacterium]
MKTFGDNFKTLRLLRKKSQKDMAVIFSMSQAAISNWEAGRQIPEVPMLIAISKYFEVSTDYLLGLED